MPTCPICLSPSAYALTAHEMMFGLREPFDYLQCSSCRSLQIANPPADLSPYYPKTYYSLADNPKPPNRLFLPFRRARAKRILAARRYTGRGSTLWQFVQWLGVARVHLNHRILDVGCGTGYLLQKLAHLGFSNLHGIDPFLASDLHFPSFTINKAAMEDIHSHYDCLILSHSLEHMPDPAAALNHVHRLLKPGGCALVAIPVADGYASQTYGPHWFCLDAPRHLLIPSDKGMRLLAQNAHVPVESAIYYGDAKFLAYSELYKRNISLNGASGLSTKELAKHFTPAELSAFTQQAVKANRENRGDVATFILRKS